ncbi:MAG: diguanylate cyclase [Deltaproteobacteria bacterium]|nr:diguanylate cyclase [Deltaproteobacteria bacterium]
MGAAPRDHIVCVDDEEGILNALRQQLAPFAGRYEIDLAASGSQALELIDELDRDREAVAMVIADQIMPEMMGVELLKEVHRRNPDTIKILLTGQAGLDAVVQAINLAGLDRYITKPWDEPDLRLTVGSLLTKYALVQENHRLVADLQEKNAELTELNRLLERRVEERTSELAEANQRLSQLAITDGLTGRYNHRYFHERLGMEVERSGRTGLPLSLLMVDVDHFKQYNDLHGHPAGDQVLRQVADMIAEGRRVNDVVARYGGEEFAILLIDTPRRSAMAVAEQLRERVGKRRFGDLSLGPGKITISVGVAACPDDATDPGELLLAADAALYAAKRAGRNRVEAAGGNASDSPAGAQH